MLYRAFFMTKGRIRAFRILRVGNDDDAITLARRLLANNIECDMVEVLGGARKIQRLGRNAEREGSGNSLPR